MVVYAVQSDASVDDQAAVHFALCSGILSHSALEGIFLPIAAHAAIASYQVIYLFDLYHVSTVPLDNSMVTGENSIGTHPIWGGVQLTVCLLRAQY